MSTLSTKKEKRTKKERKTAATAMEFYRALGMEFILALWALSSKRRHRLVKLIHQGIVKMPTPYIRIKIY